MTTFEASTSTQPAGAALVTGGGSGIGLACAQRLASAGMAVTICGRSEERLVTAHESLPAGSGHVVAANTDQVALGEEMDENGNSARREERGRSGEHAGGPDVRKKKK